MADLILSADLPTGWEVSQSSDGSELKKRFRLEVGDLMVLLEQQLGGRLRLNMLSKKIELDGTPIRAEQYPTLYVHLSKLGYKIGKQEAIDGFYAAALDNSFQPVREYLDQLADDDSVTPIDLNKVGTNYFDLNDSLYDAMHRVNLIGAVKRVYEPGCFHKTLIVYVGKQDIGKSFSVRILASPPWHKDTSQDGKDFLMALHTCWIYELAELESITNKREAGTLKNLISSVSDLIRPPYLSAHDDFPRMSIFWGSSNRRDFLRDETGGARYHVIELPHDAKTGFRIDTDRLLRDRDRIWKAAVLAYKAGESNLLNTEQRAESERRNLRYEVEDPWEDYIREWLETCNCGRAFTSEECVYLSGCKDSGFSAPSAATRFQALDQKDALRVGKILRRLGYQKDEHQTAGPGGKKRRWRLVDGSVASTQQQEPEAGQTPASGSDPGGMSQVSTPFHQKDLNQGEPVAAAAVVGKTPERSERGLPSEAERVDSWDVWD